MKELIFITHSDTGITLIIIPGNENYRPMFLREKTCKNSLNKFSKLNPMK
jgi:hypothetical protein